MGWAAKAAPLMVGEVGCVVIVNLLATPTFITWFTGADI